LSTVKRDAGILVVVAILLGIAAWLAFPIQKTNLGLDLQGGLSVILQAKATATNPVTNDSMDQAVKVIQDRVNRLGVAEPEIQRQGSDKISVQLPGIKNPDQALQIIGKTAVLEFFDVKQFGTAYASEAEALQAAGVTSADQLPAGTEIVSWPASADNPSGTDQWFVVTTPPPVNGGMLSSAGVGYDQNNRPKVDMKFNSEGTAAFGAITKKLAETAQITNETQRLAIVLDGTVDSAPTVREEIPDGSAEITGNFTLDDAKNLALVLNTGRLPVQLEPVNQNSIGAVLGKSALNQALIAGAVGLLLVIIFMIAYYRLLGVVASVALIIYGVLFIGILNGIGVTMTLPGIAGMILTLGMAVDANVLIFSRMRDEVAAGKTIGAATNAGFKKAFRAVFDCNMTTIITAIILFWAASGGIKGFALTLGIGVALSMFTAVLVTRSMLNLLSGWKPFRNPKLLGLHVPKSGMTVWHFMRHKYLFLITIGAVTLFAVVYIFVVGLDFGIDFKGGTRMEVGLEQAATVDQVRSVVTEQGIKEPVVQEVTGASGTHSFMITAQDMTDAQAKQVLAALDSQFGTKGEATGTESVGASFGKETTNRAFIACAIAIVAIIGYLTFRFEFKFAIPAIVALLHDVGLTLGLYAATGRLVTTATVAAILTILGYSVHDTIIVYDRIRENTPLMKRETYGDMVDLSIRQTMIRSINTTIALLLPLVSILIFGGPTLKDFAFALTIGIVAGTYSSFFVASPLVVIWKEREPRYRKRLAAAGAGAGVVLEDGVVQVDLDSPVVASTVAPAAAVAPARAPSGATTTSKPKQQSGGSQKSKKGKSSKRPPGK
jgi:SecD/SecF fusion protein